jgi:hypothetical protein
MPGYPHQYIQVKMENSPNQIGTLNRKTNNSSHLKKKTRAAPESLLTNLSKISSVSARHLGVINGLHCNIRENLHKVDVAG